MDKKTASLEIEKLIRDNKELSYLEAVLQWTDENEIEFRDAKKYLSASLYDKLYNECKNNNMIIDKNHSASIDEFF